MVKLPSFNCPSIIGALYEKCTIPWASARIKTECLWRIILNSEWIVESKRTCLSRVCTYLIFISYNSPPTQIQFNGRTGYLSRNAPRPRLGMHAWSKTHLYSHVHTHTHIHTSTQSLCTRNRHSFTAIPESNLLHSVHSHLAIVSHRSTDNNKILVLSVVYLRVYLFVVFYTAIFCAPFHRLFILYKRLQYEVRV